MKSKSVAGLEEAARCIAQSAVPIARSPSLSVEQAEQQIAFIAKGYLESQVGQRERLVWLAATATEKFIQWWQKRNPAEMPWPYTQKDLARVVVNYVKWLRAKAAGEKHQPKTPCKHPTRVIEIVDAGEAKWTCTYCKLVRFGPRRYYDPFLDTRL